MSECLCMCAEDGVRRHGDAGNMHDTRATDQASDTLVHKLDTLALMLAQAAAQEGLHHHTALPINTMTNFEPGEQGRAASCRTCRDSYLHAHRS